jgi:putative transposase
MVSAHRDPPTSKVVRTLRLKVRPEAIPWLNAATVEVNQVWNWCNETSLKAARPFFGPSKWLSGFDLCNLSSGATECFERIGVDTIQRVCTEFAAKRRQVKRPKLRWRVSRGARRSLGWIPFKAANLRRKGKHLRFCGKTIRLFERDRFQEVNRWRDGCFAQDAVGDWWLCLAVFVEVGLIVAPMEEVGIDLGLKDTAVTSEGERLEAGRYYGSLERAIANAQRRGHRRQAKRLHRKAARRRADSLHKFSRRIVSRYQKIVIGDVSSPKLAKTRMAKSVLDAGWGMLKTQLQYKGQQAGRSVSIVNERYTSRACSACGALTGPAGVNGLRVRKWVCRACGGTHDRDVNAARNILAAGRCPPSVCGNESSHRSACWSGRAQSRRQTRRPPGPRAARWVGSSLPSPHIRRVIAQATAHGALRSRAGRGWRPGPTRRIQQSDTAPPSHSRRYRTRARPNITNAMPPRTATDARTSRTVIASPSSTAAPIDAITGTLN